jgi:1-deoxy-D-xylulose-5-phosphate reductoisomerase
LVPEGALVKRLAILGSTGSIGNSTLDVVRSHPGRFLVTALAAGGNVELLEKQVEEFRPEIVAVKDEKAAAALARRIPAECGLLHGPDGRHAVATHENVDMVVSAFVGALGLEPTYAAVCLGRDIALANKEVLVVAGELVTRRAALESARILPVDSEHNALHQCLRGENRAEVRRLWLTASGGPFRKHSREQLEKVTREQALRHPTWSMGPKITIDSATLMNKGLEVIEARWLFGLSAERISVIVHPGSVVHSMVEFTDGSFKAQLGITDMRHPVQYALSWPERWETTLPAFDPIGAGPLEFDRPDSDRFPCLGLAYQALEAGGTAPAVLNAANEIAVQAFLEGRIRFMSIPSIVATTLDRHGGAPAAGLEELLAVDAEARRLAQLTIDQGA